MYNKSTLPFRFAFKKKKKKSEKELEPIGGVVYGWRKFFYQRKSRNPSAAVFMGGLLSLSSIEAYRRQGREKALCLGFPFLGSCVWVLQCLKER